MSAELSSLLSNNAGAVFGVAGALGGAALSFWAAFVLRKRDFRLRTWEKLLERRMAAYESVMSIATELRVMVGVGGLDPENEVRRTPQMMRSKKEFEAWFVRFTTAGLGATTWLNLETRREMNLVQDYLVTLHVHLTDVPSTCYSLAGELIRADFIDFSASLEKAAYTYFERDIHKLRLSSLKQHHKHEMDETQRRLGSTALLRNAQKIRDLANGKGA